MENENETKIRIKSLLKESGYTSKDVCEILTNSKGVRVSQQNLSNKLSKGTLRFSEALEIANACGYDLAFIKR